MIVSEIFEIKNIKNLTKSDIENFLNQKNLNAIKWSIVEFSGYSTKILVSFEKF